jgi:DNA-binding transcriptional regulator YhcF (GntR family)
MESQEVLRENLTRAAQRKNQAQHELEMAILEARGAGMSVEQIREASGYRSSKTIYNILEKHQDQ